MSPRADLLEDGRRVGGVELAQARVGHGLVGGLAQLREALDRQAHQIAQAEQPLGDEDVLGPGPELAGEPALEVLGHVGADLQAHDARRTCGRSARR